MVNLKKYFWKFSQVNRKGEEDTVKKTKNHKSTTDIRSISSSPIIGLGNEKIKMSN